MTNNSKVLTDKYRPSDWKDVVGQDLQVKSLRNALSRNSNHTYLFTGPSGTGKTTLARLAAKEVNVSAYELVEIDAASKTGIDDIREVLESNLYRPMGGGNKAIILDECHALSKSAIQALLKATEEPPDWLYWFLCTTEPGRVIKTLQTRCFRCDLKPVKSKDLQRLLLDICKNEKIKLSTDIVDLCVQGSDGSPRQAIANLAVCSVATSMEEAEELLQKEVEASEAIDLARLLVKRVSWRELQGCLQKLKDNNPESVRHIVRAYLTTVVLNAKNEDSAGACLEILDCFSQPFNSADGISPLVLACGKAVLS